jgi:ankyrin repeat protein
MFCSSAGVEAALASGAGVNDASPLDGGTALFRAAAFGHADVVRVLLEHGRSRSSGRRCANGG